MRYFDAQAAWRDEGEVEEREREKERAKTEISSVMYRIFYVARAIADISVVTLFGLRKSVPANVSKFKAGRQGSGRLIIYQRSHGDHTIFS